jgi:hypothetical protein
VRGADTRIKPQETVLDLQPEQSLMCQHKETLFVQYAITRVKIKGHTLTSEVEIRASRYVQK